MHDLTLQSRLVLEPRVRFRRFESEGILIHQKTAEAIIVSDVATRLLELADGSRSLEQCAQTLGLEFDADQEVIEGDLLAFAAELVANGIVAVSE